MAESQKELQGDSITSYTCNIISGSEYGIVLLSTVRSRQIAEDGDEADIDWIRKRLGFVANPHRICVGITRSKYGLVIVGKHGYNQHTVYTGKCLPSLTSQEMRRCSSITVFGRD